MVLFRAGAIVGQLSGSLGSNVFSHNRYGSYVRNRTVPTKSQTTFAVDAKNRLAAESQAWNALTAAEMLQWETWAQTNPITNRLGDQRVLQGNAAYVQLNARINQAGATRIDSPPVVGAPAALLTLTPTYDIGLGETDIAFTPTPLGATESLWIQAAVVNSSGIQFVQNLYKLIIVTTVAQASTFGYQVAIESRFGTLIVGQFVFFRVSVLDEATGLLSGPLIADGVVITT